MRVGGQHHAAAALPPGKTRYLLYRRLGGPRVRSGRVRETSPPTGFDPGTVQPVESRYTDWAIPAHSFKLRPIHKLCRFGYDKKLKKIDPTKQTKLIKVTGLPLPSYIK